MSIEDKIAELKKVKVPLWYQWVGWYRAFQRRRQAIKQKKLDDKKVRHIATIFAWTYWTDTQGYDKCWYILKETGAGRRFYEFGADHQILKDREKDSGFYASIVVPWTLGKWSDEQMQELERNSKKPQSANSK
jgi:hypothetical protein